MTTHLRPEVQAFAEAMQRLLEEHQAEKGDAWKGDNPHALLAAVCRKAVRLADIVDRALDGDGSEAEVLAAAASLGAHAMFVADVVCDLESPSPPNGVRDERRPSVTLVIERTEKVWEA